MKRKFKAGLTSVSLPVFIADTSSTTGGGLSGVTSASSGLVLEYRRAGQSSWTSVTPVAGKTLGTYLSGGIVADGSLAGAYEVDFPDAAFAAGARMVVCRIRGVTNMLASLIEIELDAVDYQDSAAFGLSRLDQTVGSRMATYTQPTGFLTATFPTAVASPTNITSASGIVLAAQTHSGAVIPTVTSLTNSVTVGGYSTGQAPLQPTVAGRTLDVTATGAAGIDWSNVENQGAVVQLTNTLIDQAGSVSGPVGEISGVTFPTHFDNLVIAPNGHVTATVDSINNNAITASSIQSNALTAAKFAADSITASALATDAAVEIAGKVWDEAIAAHLASGSTGEALNNAGGSGNPWITDLATGYTGTQAGNILNQVKSKTDLITTGTIQSSIPVTAQGQVTGPLFIGDDYLSANGRAFQWTVALPTGFVIATSTCRFGMEHAEGATEGASFAVAGTVTDAGGGNVTLAFSVPRATTGALKAGFYRWSVEIASASGNEVTRVASDGKKLVEWREKQT